MDKGVIRVEAGWDDVAGEIEPKSTKGRRDVPILTPLRRLLLEHLAATGRRGRDFAFGTTANKPFEPTTVRRRAHEAWAVAKLDPFGLHEARHTYVSLMVDAGFTLERIGDYIGHSSTYMVDRYRHLLEGHEQETVDRFDAYLERTAARQSRDSRAPLRAVSGGLERPTV